MELKKRLNLGSLMRKRPTAQPAHGDGDPNADTPEANAARGVVGRLGPGHLRAS